MGCQDYINNAGNTCEDFNAELYWKACNENNRTVYIQRNQSNVRFNKININAFCAYIRFSACHAQFLERNSFLVGDLRELFYRRGRRGALCTGWSQAANWKHMVNGVGGEVEGDGDGRRVT